MSVSILPSVDKNVFVSGSCDSLAKVTDALVRVWMGFAAVFRLPIRRIVLHWCSRCCFSHLWLLAFDSPTHDSAADSRFAFSVGDV